jgi:glycosyl transferase family 25
MTATAARLGFSFIRVPAVDGQDPRVAAAAAAMPAPANGARMSTGAYGCFASHQKFWQLLVDSGAPHGMVMEDDLDLAEGIAQYLADDWVPPQADIVRLETFGTRIHLDRAPVVPAHGRSLRRMRSTHLGTGCYVISAPMAARLLAETRQFSDPIDQFLFNSGRPFFPTAQIWQMTPAPVAQGKRPGAVSATESWIETSITERFAGPDAALVGGPEGRLPRLMRRGREELRARLLATSYVVVPFG